MKELLITSSVLIVFILILRTLFSKTISRRLQYALWGLVLLRLLIPVNLPAIRHNALTTVETVTGTITEQFHGPAAGKPSVHGEMAEVGQNLPDAPDLPVEVVQQTPETENKLDTSAPEETADTADRVQITEAAGGDMIAKLLRPLWFVGMVAVGSWMLVANLRFWLRLRKERILYDAGEQRLPVYLVERGLASPCLFGLFQPAIYLTPEAVRDGERLRHVLAHERTHARHLDTLWSALRCVCLTVYWFDPLVWVAAIVSRTDCELACDEGAVQMLGEEERIPYGRTLLSLIPVRNGVENPMLAATTMSSEKQRLKERITRIAENRKTVTAAVCLALAAAAVLVVMTFTGNGLENPASHGKGPHAGVDGPVSGEELRYFNQVFFNNDTFDNVVGLNIHNQFLGSIYEDPKDIDLYELFYCGIGMAEELTEAERQEFASLDHDGMEICPTDKLSTAAMDQVLRSNTGIGLDETAHIGLENFQYSQEQDAYYHSHGDTNYFHSVNITAGEREGELVRLYYRDNYGHHPETEWLCVTLRQLPGDVPGHDQYHFVSNLPVAEPPAIPTLLPQGEPQFTFSLADLEPLKLRSAEVSRASDDCAERGSGFRLSEDVSVRTYLSTDGNVYAAIVYEEIAGRDGMSAWEVGRFFQYPEGTELNAAEMFTFSQFGYSGVAVAYSGEVPGQTGEYTTIYDYYAFDERGTPSFLFRTYGAEQPISVDLDGDGTTELAAKEQVFFQKDGQIFEANLRELLTAAWPELSYWDWSWWDPDMKCLKVFGSVNMPSWGEGETASFWREVYFDGDQLLVYKEETTTEDHISSGVSRNFPPEVMERAMKKAEQEKDAFIQNTSANGYDDWRLSHLSPVTGYKPFDGVDLEIYAAGWEVHPKQPTNQMLAGGMYLDEAGWLGGSGSDPGPYLVFSIEDGTRTYLGNAICGDCSVDSIAFRTDLGNLLLESGKLTVSDLTNQELLNFYMMGTASFLNRAAAWSESDQTILLDALQSFHHTGWFREELDLRDAMTTTAWCSRDLTEEGMQLFRKLQEMTGIHSFGVGEIYQDLETAIHQSLVEYRYNASAHKDDFYEVAYRLLDSDESANTVTCYLSTNFASYNRTDDSYKMETGGQAPVILSFATVNGTYQLTEYWEPLGGTLYAADIERCFPGNVHQEILSPDDAVLGAMEQECAQAARDFFAG